MTLYCLVDMLNDVTHANVALTMSSCCNKNQNLDCQ